MATTDRYLAVTFDSQTVYSNGFRLGSGLLNELPTLRGNKFPIVLSQVVASEISKGFRNHVREELDRLKSTHAKLLELDIVVGDSPMFADRASEAQDAARIRLDRFWKEIGATFVSPDLIPVSKLLEPYFNEKPPFNSKNKKAEFPDAISLFSLEAYARREGQKILAISEDNDWVNFCKTSDWIDVVPKVRDALRIVYEQLDQMRAEKASRQLDLALKLVSEIDDGTNERLTTEFKKRLSDALNLTNVEAVAQGPYLAQGDQVEFRLKEFELDTNRNAIGFSIFSPIDDVATIELPCLIYVDATAAFSLSYWDGVDHEYIPMGDSRDTITTWIDTRIIVRMHMRDHVEITDVEVVEAPASLDFGQVEPGDEGEYFHPEDYPWIDTPPESVSS